MKKIIFILISIITITFVSSCEKDNPIDDATTKQFISIDDICVDLSESSLEVIGKDYTELKSKDATYIGIAFGNLVDRKKVDGYTTSTYNKVVAFDLTYPNESVNHKTNIGEADELYVTGSTSPFTTTEGNGYFDCGYERTKDGKIVGVGYNGNNNIAPCFSIKITGLESEEVVDDSFISGWYLVKEVSSYELNVSGEFKTKMGHEVKFNFNFLK